MSILLHSEAAIGFLTRNVSIQHLSTNATKETYDSHIPVTSTKHFLKLAGLQFQLFGRLEQLDHKFK